MSFWVTLIAFGILTLAVLMIGSHVVTQTIWINWKSRQRIHAQRIILSGAKIRSVILDVFLMRWQKMKLDAPSFWIGWFLGIATFVVILTIVHYFVMPSVFP